MRSVLVVSLALNISLSIHYLKTREADSIANLPNPGLTPALGGGAVNPAPVEPQRAADPSGSWFGGVSGNENSSGELKANVERDLLPEILAVLNRRMTGINFTKVDVEGEKYFLQVDVGENTSTIQMAEVHHLVLSAMNSYADQNAKLKGRRAEIQMIHTARPGGN